jgi:hypothetical protein
VNGPDQSVVYRVKHGIELGGGDLADFFAPQTAKPILPGHAIGIQRAAEIKQYCGGLVSSVHASQAL